MPRSKFFRAVNGAGGLRYQHPQRHLWRRSQALLPPNKNMAWKPMSDQQIPDTKESIDQGAGLSGPTLRLIQVYQSSSSVGKIFSAYEGVIA